MKSDSSAAFVASCVLVWTSGLRAVSIGLELAADAASVRLPLSLIGCALDFVQASCKPYRTPGQKDLRHGRGTDFVLSEKTVSRSIFAGGTTERISVKRLERYRNCRSEPESRRSNPGCR